MTAAGITAAGITAAGITAAGGMGGARGRTRRREAPSHTSLLALFILSPTAGTVVVVWRGMKALLARYRERHALEGRALGLRHRAYAPVVHPHVAYHCPACGFGVLGVLGDARVREFLRRPGPRGHARQPQPHDLRCDRPGCHHIAARHALPAA